MLERPFAIHWTPYTLKFMLGALVVYAFAIVLYISSRQNRRPGEEHGSARWGNVYQLDRKYRDKDPHNNAILTQNLRMSLNGRKHQRNLLQIVVGGSGAGKTRYVVKPNLYEANASYIATDPKGELARSAVPLLLREGYTIRVIDLVDPEHSDCYNPFHYIRNDADVLKLIANFIRNTTPKNAHSNDPFWEKSEIALDSALMLYLLHEAPPEEQTMEMMLTMLEYGAAKEGDGDYQSPLDLLFEALEEENPNHIALRQYKVFKQAPSETAMSILITASVRLAPFTLPEVQRITSRDTMELGKLGERKQAVFCIIPDSNDASLNFLVGMLYTQAFQELYYQADKVHGGSLPIPVRLMFDEFANVALPDGYADPPWNYRVWSCGGLAKSHYPTMTIEDIKALPVSELAADDCALFLWITMPMLCEAWEVMEAWGFSYKTAAFVWIKLNQKADSVYWGMGHWTRANAELCLLATRGTPRRQAKNIHQVILSRIEEHSKKPEEARRRIEALMGDVPRVELFARRPSPGWDVWGNEVDSTIDWIKT